MNQALCKILEWDTHFFGVKIGRVLTDTLSPDVVSSIDLWCRENQVRCLYFLARADDALTSRLAEDNGFHLVDVRIAFIHQGRTRVSTTSKGESFTGVLRRAMPADIPLLQRITLDNYRDSRYYYDDNFPLHLCNALYETWIRVSCEGYATAVLIAELDKIPVGFITCHLDSESSRGSIGLVGISKEVQRRGIGVALISEAIKWFHAKEAEEIAVVTQGRNIAAQRFYQRCGFLTESVGLWYHKWYSTGCG
jgi:dTDP-4-amino-4,6-dideoxy-D-galactose acyltransferase